MPSFVFFCSSFSTSLPSRIAHYWIEYTSFNCVIHRLCSLLHIFLESLHAIHNDKNRWQTRNAKYKIPREKMKVKRVCIIAFELETIYVVNQQRNEENLNILWVWIEILILLLGIFYTASQFFPRIFHFETEFCSGNIYRNIRFHRAIWLQEHMEISQMEFRFEIWEFLYSTLHSHSANRIVCIHQLTIKIIFYNWFFLYFIRTECN